MPLFSPEDIVLSWPSKLFLRGVCVAGLLLLASCLPYLGVRKDSSSGIQTMLAGLRKPFSVLKSRLQAWIFLFRGTEIIHNSFKRVSTCPLKRCLLCGFVLIRITVQRRTILRRCSRKSISHRFVLEPHQGNRLGFRWNTVTAGSR